MVEVEWGHLGPAVRWEASRAKAQRVVGAETATTLIVPGFIARDPQGIQTTLGRNGSDFSASILGDLLSASEIHIWTDVDGVLSADPRRVPDARVIDALSYYEAMELAYFGAKVIHPQTMAPAVAKQIPIWIRNTFAPEKPGTLICATPESTHAVKGITSIDKVALINLEGAGMIGVPGTAQRLFGALREDGISVILISQGSSEHSICFAVLEADAERTERTVRRAFAAELRDGQIQNVDVLAACSILSVVGDGMAGTPGIAAKVFAALAGAGVNVRAIAQGSSERNISVVIDEKQITRALRAAHAAFYLSPHTVSIGVVGPGVVGRTLLNQMWSQVPRLLADFNLDLRIRALMTSKRMLLAEPAVNEATWQADLAAGPPVDVAAFEEHVHADHIPHAVIIDCSASEDGGRAVSAVAGRRDPRGHAQQARQQRSADALRQRPGGAPRQRRPLPVRSHGRRRPADHADAARPARDRRRDPPGGGHLLGHAGLPVQRVGRRAAVLGHRARRQGEGLHRAGPARRPVGHRRRPQARDPGARARACGWNWRTWRWKA